MNKIKEILEVKGLSQTELAEKLGKSFNMVNLYVRLIKFNHQYLFYIKLQKF